MSLSVLIKGSTNGFSTQTLPLGQSLTTTNDLIIGSNVCAHLDHLLRTVIDVDKCPKHRVKTLRLPT